MFVLITAVCCYLGWESSIARQQQAVLRELKANTAFQVTTSRGDAKGNDTPNEYKGNVAHNATPAAIPWVRSWLGDEAVQEIGYKRYAGGFSDRELSRFTRAF